jgi:hypothetical protein
MNARRKNSEVAILSAQEEAILARFEQRESRIGEIDEDPEGGTYAIF